MCDWVVGIENSIGGVLNSIDGVLNSIDGVLNSIDGVPNSIDGVPNSIDGVPNSIDAGLNSIDGALNSIDGGRSSIDGGRSLNRWGSELNEWRIGGPILEIKAPKVRFRRGAADCVGVGSSVCFFRMKHLAGLFDYLRMAAWRMASSSLCRQRAPQPKRRTDLC